jgi:hypothetical protein
VRATSASYALAEEFLVIPYPFSGEDRSSIEAEYMVLLENGIHPKEISDMILDALQILLNARAKAKDEAKQTKLTGQVSDMLGRLLVFEELIRGDKK